MILMVVLSRGLRPIGFLDTCTRTGDLKVRHIEAEHTVICQLYKLELIGFWYREIGRILYVDLPQPMCDPYQRKEGGALQYTPAKEALSRDLGQIAIELGSNTYRGGNSASRIRLESAEHMRASQLVHSRAIF